MGLRAATHTFQGAMIKDLDKSLVTKDKYLDAHNFKLITSTGESTGALENVEGNNNIYPTIGPGALTRLHKYIVVKGTATYNGADYTLGQTFTVLAAPAPNTFSGAGSLVIDANAVMPDNLYVVGSVYIRDTIVLFLTSNTGSAPSGGRSMLVKLGIVESTETFGTVTVLYDDSLNNSTGTLNFSTYYPIRTVGIYETPTIQKVYWCDDYNNMRYANIAAYLTTDRAVYTTGVNFYFSPDLFEFLPAVTLTKPTLDSLSPGSISAGMVQYGFQYYINHGAETAVSPLSDIIHLTNSDDYGTISVYYEGESSLTSSSGKSVQMLFSIPDSDKYDYIRIIRLHYVTVNSLPTITVVGELSIDPTLSSILFLDNGEQAYGTLTLTEVNLNTTTLFSAKDITTKDNRLFATNIKNDEFDITGFDTRAIRYRHWHETRSDTTAPTDIICVETGAPPIVDYVTTMVDNNTFSVVLTVFRGDFCGGENVQTVTDVEFTAVAGNDVEGDWHGGAGGSMDTVFNGVTVSNIVYNYGADTLTFNVDRTVGDFFGVGYDHIDNCTLFSVTFDYTYIDAVATVDAAVTDSAGPGSTVVVAVPAADTYPGWAAAGWDVSDLASTFPATHDAINEFNNPSRDGSAEYGYQFQTDGATYGAEGPNIIIGFALDTMELDNGGVATRYSCGLESTSDNKSFTSFASPYLAGRKSWQRDEVYRLYLVFFDDRGRSSSAKWVCDLRMPSIHEATYQYLIQLAGGHAQTEALYPTFRLKNLPSGAVSAQLLRVARGGSDRSILTQALVVPTDVVAAFTRPQLVGTVLAGTLHKLVSPEINITKNISKGATDYLEYVGYYTPTTSIWGTFVDFIKCDTFTRQAYGANCKSTILDTMYVEPHDDSISFTFGGVACKNYDSVTNAYGSSGLLVDHSNASWTAIGAQYALVNYKRDVHQTQYGGQTYESRYNNITIPASGLVTSTVTTYTAWNGDTFINFFDVSTQLFDLAQTDPNSMNEAVYVPVESSINCDLRHDVSIHRAYALGGAGYYLTQETPGSWVNGSGTTYNQEKALYQYNTVYSQEANAKFYTNIPDTVSSDTDFDCMIKTSDVKINGESQDSFTKFGVNNFIEVDTSYGPVASINVLNDKLFFWQRNAFGLLSVNTRSLIQDSQGSALVLGTGGVLDRYDYLSTSVGSSDPQHVLTTPLGIFWLSLDDKSIYRFTEGLENISKSKQIQSWFESQLSPTQVAYNVIRTVYDKRYNQILFSFYNTNTAVGTTLVYDESLSVFSGFYDYYTLLFIPYLKGYLSVKHDYTVDLLYYHNSILKDRCCFYSYIPSVGAAETLSGAPKYVNSTVKVLFNDEYDITKVFDNFEYVSTVTVNDIELYNNTFSSIRCYNNYQNTDYCTLTYGTNLERDERAWTTFIPRNAVDVVYTSNPNVFDAGNIDKTRLFKERIRDKHMVTDFVYTNTSNRKIIIPYITVKYRVSPR